VLFGALLLAVLVAYAALERKPGGGYLQRAAIVLFSVGVAALALRVRRLAGSPTADAESSFAGLPSPPARSCRSGALLAPRGPGELARR
jgi:hypothetical protein